MQTHAKLCRIFKSIAGRQRKRLRLNPQAKKVVVLMCTTELAFLSITHTHNKQKLGFRELLMLQNKEIKHSAEFGFRELLCS